MQGLRVEVSALIFTGDGANWLVDIYDFVASDPDHYVHLGDLGSTSESAISALLYSYTQQRSVAFSSYPYPSLLPLSLACRSGFALGACLNNTVPEDGSTEQ